jgi:nucleoid-associated protein YgaU
VQSGDTLSSIAARWFGDHRKWDLIADANDVDPDRLRVGQRLRLPARDRAARDHAARDAPRSRTASRTPARPRRYVVRTGDTLSSIADDLWDDPALWKHLYAANRNVVSNPDRLAVGMRLAVPDTP